MCLHVPFIRSAISQYTEESRYIDDTACTSTGWSWYYCTDLFQWYRRTVLALRRVPELSAERVIVVMMPCQTPAYLLCSEKAASLPGFHALTGADMIGHIPRKWEPACYKAILKAPDDMTSALGGLGVGACPSDQVLCGCQQFQCQPFNHTAVTAMQVKWHMLKQLKPNQWVEKLSHTPGATNQHILHAHCQANLWAQDTVADPTMLDPVGLGSHEDDDGTYISTGSRVANTRGSWGTGGIQLRREQ